MNVPFLDLNRMHDPILGEINEAIYKVVSRGNFILGDEVFRFEESFAKFCDCDFAIGVANGTDAIELSLAGYDIGYGDEVIVPANTFHATAAAVSNVGAKPVLVDVLDDYTLDFSKIEESLTDKTRAIIPVHLYGKVCDMNPILDIAAKNNLKVFEDACQAHGAKYMEKRAGSFGDAAAFSFYPGKNLGSFGDAGIITTNDPYFADRVKAIRKQGQSKKYVHNFIGRNSRMDTIQAAVLNVKLKYLDEWNNSRSKSSEFLNNGLEGLVATPNSDSKRDDVHHLYVVRTEDREERDSLNEYLSKQSIQCGLHYPKPIHLQEAFSHLEYKKGSFPVSEKFSDTILSLPIFPYMKEGELSKIVSSVENFYSQK